MVIDHRQNLLQSLRSALSVVLYPVQYLASLPLILGGDASDEMPDWIGLYPGASEPEGAYSSTSGDQRTGAVSFRSTDPVARVLEYYERTLKAAGLEVEVKYLAGNRRVDFEAEVRR